jgi:hypothetical protein
MLQNFRCHQKFKISDFANFGIFRKIKIRDFLQYKYSLIAFKICDILKTNFERKEHKLSFQNWKAQFHMPTNTRWSAAPT